MEQATEVETVYYIETPYAANEEEIATSYIAVEENEVGVENNGELVCTYVDQGETEDSENAINSGNNEIIIIRDEDTRSASNDEVEILNNDEMEVVNNDEMKIVNNDEVQVVNNEIVEVNNENIEAAHDEDDDDNSGPDEQLPEGSTIQVPVGPADCFTCKFCFRRFTKICNKQRHIRRVHHIRRETETSIQCVDCKISFGQVSRLREHLSEVHKLEMGEEHLRFPSMEAFLKWKCEIERKTVCSYTLRHGARKGSQGPRYFYACHRSGKYAPKVRGPRQRMIKTQGSCKMGIMCTASISVQVTQIDVAVKYCPHHYGHGKDSTLVHLSTEEHNAITESVSKGISYDSILNEIRDSQTNKDHFQLHLLKKKDYRSINNSYAFEDFNTEMEDGESVDHWVTLCCQMENSPVLYYKKEEQYTDKGSEEEFILIIMTEFQKHILLSSDRQVLCVDSLYRKKGGRFYLTVLFIMDENNLAFPVAFCISNKVDKHVITLFYQSLHESTGKIECQYFMSDSEPFYYEAWKEVMQDESKWLWSMWYVDSRFRIQLRVFKGNVTKRADAYKKMRMLLECHNQTVFQCMLENFIESLKNDPDSKDLGNIVKNHYAPNADIWAYCFRKEIALSTNIHLEIMHRTFRYCCREGRKTRMDKFIFVIMKLVRDKMLDRLTNMMDDERIDLALETINVCHNLGVEISPENINTLSEKKWLVYSEAEEEHYYVMLENATCPEHCNLKCKECNICVHMYTCNCIHNLINANLCQHIHAVVWHLLTPHFTPPTSPVPLLSQEETFEQETSSQFLQKLLKKTHEVYKQIQINRSNLNKVALNSLMKRMNECVEICLGKVLDDKPPAPPPQNPAPMLLINPMAKPGNNQPYILPNIINPNNGPIPAGGGYVLIVPNSASTPTAKK